MFDDLEEKKNNDLQNPELGVTLKGKYRYLNKSLKNVSLKVKTQRPALLNDKDTHKNVHQLIVQENEYLNLIKNSKLEENQPQNEYDRLSLQRERIKNRHTSLDF